MDVGGQVFSHGSGCTQETAGSSTTHKAARVTAVTQGLSHNSGASICDSMLCPAKDTHKREFLLDVPQEVDTPLSWHEQAQHAFAMSISAPRDILVSLYQCC